MIIQKSLVTFYTGFIVSASQFPSFLNKIQENKVKHRSCYLRVQAMVPHQNKKNKTVLSRTKIPSISNISRPVTQYICSIMELGRSFLVYDLGCASECVCEAETVRLLLLEHLKN